MTGLYIHIPFCVKKCHYCNFVITSSGSSGKRGDFLEALEKEMIHHKPRFEETFFDTLYLGGGTPSVLTLGETEKLFFMIRSHFRLKPDAEITCEVNPADLDAPKARLYRSLGVNRISLGAQSFKEETLKNINRDHSVRDIFASHDLLIKEGFKNISIDLILSLPEETLEDVKHSLKQAVTLGVNHVSLYELTIEEKTVFGRRHQQGRLPLPPEDAQLKMLSYARGYLRRHGFEHYELLSYARPGFKSRHNLLYWANEAYLGLGPGAFSYLDGRRFQYSSSYEDYLEKIERQNWTAHEEEVLSPAKKEIESFLLALRLREGASTRRFRRALGPLKEAVESLAEKGLLAKDSQKIRLTPRGQLFAETVFTELSSV